MTDDRSPPPAEACLCRPYPSSQKGGTLIAEDVTSLQQHARRLASAGYRPAACPRCKAPLHIHDYRPRLLLGHPAEITTTVRFRCADREQCGAVWHVLPGFVARHLWRHWETVEETIQAEPSGQSPVPAATRARWRTRLEASALVLVQILATAVGALAQALARQTPRLAIRQRLLGIHGQLTGAAVGKRLGSLAALIHRHAPGVRVM